MKINLVAIAIGGVLTIVVVASAAWFVFFKPVSTGNKTPATSVGLGSGTTQTVTTPRNTTNDNGIQTLPTASNTKQKIFKIAAGPVTGATFIQTLYPTTTLVRYVMQENGHFFDLSLDTPGAIARASSNVTIPATARAWWAESGTVTYMQYLDAGTIKTVTLTFPNASLAKGAAPSIRIQFLPDGIADLAVSPSGKQIAYLLKNQGGVDGYIANSDGNSSKKIFSLGLSEILLSWPSANTLLLTEKSGSSAPGIVFSVDTKSGGVVPLIYALGITATADKNFSHVIYQATTDGSAARSSYTHDNKKGLDAALAFDPIPEKCTWSLLATSTMYCAVPGQYIGADYLDLWHMGAASVADSLMQFDIANNTSGIITTPGEEDGGEKSDISEIAVSPDEKYLLFIKKGDRSLWGVRLTQ